MGVAAGPAYPPFKDAGEPAGDPFVHGGIGRLRGLFTFQLVKLGAEILPKAIAASRALAELAFVA